MNRNAQEAFKVILETPELAEKFRQLDNLKEMYDFAHSIKEGYSIEEFEKHITEVIEYAQNYFNENKLTEEALDKISGGNIINKYGKSIIALGMSQLLAIAPVLPSVGAHDKISSRPSHALSKKSDKKQPVSKWLEYTGLATGSLALAALTLHKLHKHNAEAVVEVPKENSPLAQISNYLKFNLTQIKMSPEERVKSYIKGRNIKAIDYKKPQDVLGEELTEDQIRQEPTKYFFQDQDGFCYVKDVKEELHCAGRFFIPNLDELKAASLNVPAAGEEGKIIIVHSNNKILDIHNILDSNIFELANPASNHNAIETLHDRNHNKKLEEYWIDNTQGPWFMKKCPWTSLFLLHVLNGTILPVKEDSPHAGLFKYLTGLKQYELNLLADYEVPTSAGYAKNVDSYKNKIVGEENDRKFRCLIAQGAPIVLKGGVAREDSPYQYIEDGQKIDIFIDASIPYQAYEGSRDEQVIKEHLRRHYHALFSLCKATRKKRVCISMTGTGVFNVSMQWHIEVLSRPELIQEMKESGTTYIFNAFMDPSNNINLSKAEHIKLQNVHKFNSLSDVQ